MKRMNSHLPAGVLALTVRFAFSCSKQAIQIDRDWSATIKVTDSIDNLVSGLHLCKFRNTIMGIQSLEKGTNN